MLTKRLSSRSVCSSIAEAYRKRRYEARFISKASDSDMENSETRVLLEFSLECKYISNEIYADLLSKSEEIGKLLNHMIENPKSYLRKSEKNN